MNAKHKAAIRAHWASFELRFTKDGRVLARKAPGSSWGVLYTATQLQQHLAVLTEVCRRMAQS